MKAWGGRALGACATFALLALPGIAVAKPRSLEVQPRSLHLSLRTRTSNGYGVSIQTLGHKQVSLRLAKGSVAATYTVAGRVSRHGIKADFGELGQVALRFKGTPRPSEPAPDRRVEKKPPSNQTCKGRRPVREEGAFRGAIHFEGEGGFTRIDARRAKGTVLRVYRRVCTKPRFSPAFASTWPQRGGRNRADLLVTMLIVRGPTTGRSLAFGAFSLESSLLSAGQNEAPSISFFSASTSERVGRVGIKRLALVGGEPGDFLFSRLGHRPFAATVTLSKPFSGSATYREGAGSPPTWDGSLVVSLPGLGPTPLTGPEFQARACQATSPKQLSKCIEASKRGLARASAAAGEWLLQGSGSHSQAFWDARLSWSR